ncbi:uncharacterized protein MONOS_1174 [Monocercomonoides exilis]|uniref:uncharacterized protein n=1 Tax=Monocercomonoides exilis TaxID=2049356 RepID=UPI00355AC5CF|nr:hypothetical protein MONOS_1174 [Monocercomonoides exilis]|eukprot:MONOS_1174.1-p1 / transcript=MONOS_1174.1 / gene=MONOS_1174 / organism=Monocercomonoides_exilis_PA203 / gene_product=unspecified product / transcript_product=unspecified product / location=Mono_scaffold00020:34148-36424(-) / protein_length=586 / sequence_SO=supercontig / SO=protein_coding / is_pseudo=false
MQWSVNQPNSQARQPGTTHSRTPKAVTVRPFQTGPITIRSIPTAQTTPLPQPQIEADQEDSEVFTQKFISNLQGQIHLLELESKLLKERLSGDQEKKGPDLDEVDTSDVDPALRELRKMYHELEQEGKNEKERLLDLINKLLNDRAILLSAQERLTNEAQEAKNETQKVMEETESMKKPFSKQIAALKQQIQATDEELKRASDEKDRLKEELEFAVTRSSQLKNLIDDQKKSLRDKDSQLAPLKDLVAELAEEEERLRAQLNECKEGRKEDEDIIRDAKEKLSQLQHIDGEGVAAVRQKEMEAESLRTTKDRIDEENRKIMKENGDLRREIAVAKENIASLSAETAQMKKQTAQLEANGATEEKEARQESEKANECRNKAAAIERECGVLRSKIDAIHRDIDNTKDKIDDLLSDDESKQAEMAHLTATVRLQKSDLDALQRSASSLREQLAAMVDDNTMLQKENDRLAKRAAFLASLELGKAPELVELRETNQKMERTLAALKKKIAEGEEERDAEEQMLTMNGGRGSDTGGKSISPGTRSYLSSFTSATMKSPLSVGEQRKKRNEELKKKIQSKQSEEGTKSRG